MKKTGRQPQSQNRFRCKVVATAVAACFAADIAFANPTGPVVVNGQVSFARAGSVLSVTNSPSSIINWQQFSIAGGETTRFIQQSAASAVLNRVVGVDPSSILGTLQSNGRVFLINPSGIMFGAGSQIDVAGLVASTLRLSNEDFLAGRMNFVADPAHTAAVVNQGRISASPGGQVYLIGAAVDNQGVITAPNGDIVLAAGNSVRVTDGTGSRLQVEIRAPADSTVNLSEAVYGSRGIYGGLVRNSGTISANSVVRTADGRIVLKASGDVTLAAGSSTTANGASGGTVSVAAGGTASVSGAVEAKGDAGSGGRVEISGDLTGVFDGARVNASGTTGGGTILVGGDAHGSAIISGGTESPNSQRTFVGRDTELRADAIESGDGGKVVVWADDTTRFYGSISARGGAQGGNGGFVEVSGKDTLTFKGSVDTRAPQGKTGTLLLDPANIVIADGSGDSTNDGADASTTSFAGSGSGTGVVVSGDNPVGGTLTLFQSELEGIASTTNISLQATSTITINDLANNNLNLAQGGGNSVSFDSATFRMAAGDTITTAGGNLNITTAWDATIGGLTTGTGLVTLNLGAASTASGVISSSGGLTKLGTGTLTLSGTNTYSGATTIAAGTINANSSSALGDGSATNTLIFNGGGLQAGGAITSPGTRAVTLNSTGVIDTNGNAVSIAGVASGAGGLIKNGSGTLTLSGANTYTGATTVNAGTLKAGVASVANVSGAFGNNSALILVDAAGATLDITGFNTQLGSLAGGGASGGNVTLGAATLTIGGDNTSPVAYAGVISGTGAAAIAKIGSGTLTLKGANTYAGSTTLTAGTLNANSSAALGDGSATNTLIFNGGTLNATGNITSPGTRGVTLNSAGTIDTNVYNVSIAGAVTGGAVGLAKNGTGTLTLSGTNTYTGETTINAGTLRLSGGAAIADTGAVSLANAAGVTLDLNGSSETIGSLAGGGTAGGTVTSSVAGAITLTAGGDNTSTAYSGVVQNGSGTVALAKAGSGTLTLSGANTYTGATTISVGAIRLTGNGTLGTVAAGTTVSATGAALELDGVGTVDALTLAGTGIGTGGALRNISGANAVTGNIALTGATRINSDAGTLTVSTGSFTGAQNLTVGGTGNTAVSSVIGTAAGTLTKDGAGTLNLSGVNTYTGATTITAGTLALDATGTIATSSGVANNATLTVAASKTIDSMTGAGATTISAGVLTIGDASNTAATYDGVMSGAGALTKAGTGTLTLSGANTYTGATTIGAGAIRLTGSGTLGTAATGTTVSAGTALELDGVSTADALTLTGTGIAAGGALRNIAGASAATGGIILTGATRINSDAGTLTVSTGNITGAQNLTVGGAGATTVSSVIGTETGTLTKDLAGTVTLSGANTYTGATTISAGAIRLTGSGTLGTTAAGTTVASGAALELDGVGTADALTLAGTGIGTGGALRNISGANAVTGNIALTGATRINSDAGTLTVSTGSFTGAQNLTVGGTGNTTVSSVIGTAAGTLTKDGAGTLTLSGVNTYTGATTITAGTLALDATGTIATSSGVANNATLTVAASKTIDSMTGAGATTISAGVLTIGDASNTAASYNGVMSGAGGLTKNGTGILTLTGANDYTGATEVNGPVVLSGANGSLTATSLVTVNQGSTLTLSNTATNSNTRIFDTAGLTLNGGTFIVLGNAANDTSEILGALKFDSGYSTVTLTPDAAQNTYVNFASFTRTAGALGLFRGTALGVNTIASLTNGSANIEFAAAPALIGAGANNTTSAGIIPGAIGATTSASNGTDFVTTLNAGAGAGTANGLRILSSATEYVSDLAPALGVNYRLTGARTQPDPTVAVNSILLTSGAAFTYNYDSVAGGTTTITVDSGNILSAGGAAHTFGPGQAAASPIAFGAVEGKIFAVNNLTFGGATTSSVTGTGGVSKGGAGTWIQTAPSLFTGGITLNSGTLQLGAAERFVDTNPLTVAAGATFNLNGFNETIGALNVRSGNTLGATVTLAANNLTLGGDVTHTVEGSGTTGASITSTTGLLALGATRNFTVADGLAANDLAVSAIVSGAGFGITKAGAGTLRLTGVNTYTGVTTINAGTLSIAAETGLGGNPGALAAGQLTINGGTLATTATFAIDDANRGITIGANDATIDVAAATTLTVGAAAAATNVITGAAGADLTKTGTGALTLLGTSANTNAGLTTVTAGTLNLSKTAGVNAIGGALTVATGGTAALAAANQIGASAVTVSGGTLSTATFADTVGAVTLTSGSITAGAGGTLTGTSYAVESGTISAILGDTGGSTLTKTTGGTVTLTGVNTYAGATTLTGGILSANSTDALGSGVASNTLIFNGGTLQAGGAIASPAARGVTMTGTGTLNTNGNAVSLAGVVTGANALTKTGTGTLTLSGNNAAFSGGVAIKAGTVSGTTSANAFGTGTITLGDTTGSAASTLDGGFAGTFTNAISVASGNTGVATITSSAASTFSGAVTLNSHNLSLSPAASNLGLSGGITGTGNLTLNSTGVGIITLSGASVNNTGTLTNSGAGGGDNVISGGVGANVTAITQSSTTSALTIDTTALTVNGAGTTLTNTAGTSLLTVSSGVTGAGNLTLNNNSATANGITLSGAAVNNAGTITNSGSGAGVTLISGGVGSNVTAITQSSNTSALTVSTNNLTVNSAGTTLTKAGTALLTVSSNVAGSGDLVLNNNSATANGITLSGASVNNAGAITNSGTGAGSSLISGVVGAGVTGVVQNSASSALTLSGNNNTYAGGLNIKSGTVNGTTSANAFGTGTITLGDTGGSANATLNGGLAGTFANPISVANGNAGTATITSSAASVFSGAVTLNSHDLRLSPAGTALSLSGGITGTGNLTLNSTGAGIITLSGASVNHDGTITNTGAGGAANVISAVIGTNVDGVTQNSATSLLTLSGANTYTGTTTVNAGALRAGIVSVANTSGAFGNNSAVTLANTAGAVLNLNGFATQIGSITGGGVNGGNVTLGAVTLTAGGDNTSPAAYAGAISSTGGGLTKIGTGTLTLSGASTYTGRTSIQNGTVSVASLNSVVAGAASSNLGAPVTVANGTIDLGSGATAGALVYTGTGETTDRVINLAGTTGGGTLDQSGTGLLKFNPALTATGVGSKTLTLQGSSAGVAEIAAAIVNSAGNTTALTKAGSGTWVLSGANTYTGTTTINGGTLKLAGGAAIVNTGAVVLANTAGVKLDLNDTTETIGSLAGGGTTGGAVTNGGSSIATLITGDASNTTFAGVIENGSGTGTALTKQGAGIFTLSGANTYTGATTINAGTLKLAGGSALADTGAVVLANAAVTLDLAGGTEIIGSLAGGASGGIVTSSAGAATLITGNGSNTTFSGVIENGGGTLALIKQGSGVLTLAGANTYTDLTNVNVGTLKLSGGSAIQNTGAVALADVAGAKLDLNDTTETVGSLAGGGATGGIVTNSGAGAATLITGDASNTTFAGVIENGTGTGTALIKLGSGIFTLSGANTFSNGLTIKAGTVLGTSVAANAFGTGTITLGDGAGGSNDATLLVGTDGLTYSNAIVLAPTTTGTLTIGNSGTAISTTFSGGVTGTNNLTINSNATSGTVTLATGMVNNTGKITNTGAGTGTTTISAAVGSNVTEIIENSATSALTVSGAVTVGASNKTFRNSNAGGSSLLTISGGMTGAGDVVLDNDSAIANGITVSNTSLNNTGTVTNLGSGSGASLISAAVGSNVTGITQDSSTSALDVTGALNVNGGGTTLTNSNTAALTLAGGVGGTGNLVLNNDSTTAAGITLSTTAVNNAGTVTNSGSGTGGSTISAVIGTNVTGVTQNSGTSVLTLSGANTYSGATTIIAGTLNANASAAIGDGSATNTLIFNGGTLQAGGTITSPATRAVTMTGNGTIDTNGNTVSIAGAFDGAGALDLIGNGTVTFGNTVGNTTALASVTQNAATTLNINGGSVRTAGAQTYGGIVTSSGATTLTSTGGGNITAINTSNNFTGNLALSTGGDASIVDSNVLALGAASADTLTAKTLAGDLTINGAVTAATSIQFEAGNSTAAGTATGGDVVFGTGSLASGQIRIYTGSVAGSTGIGAFVGPNNSRYNSSPTTTNFVTPLGTLNAIYREQPILSVDNASKIYGTSDPAQPITGYVNGDSGGLAGSVARVAGENAGTYDIATGTIASNVGYGFALNGTPKLTITQAAAPTASIAGNAGTTKTYGTNDPALTTVTLTPTGGFVNATVTDWNGANTTITDVASVASLARAGGEDVGNYAITGGTLSILNTVASTNSTGNYAAPVVSTSGNLVITQAAAPTASIAGNAGTTKTYGTNDPALTTVTLTPTGGFVNATVTDWNGANTTITDVASVASLARAGGEDVGNYAITGGTLSILNTVASTNSTGNYAAPVVSTSGNLVITQAAAPTASIAGNAGTTKTYGTNDPALTTVTLTPTGGFVNATVTDWNGANTTITDVASVASLARAGGEDVGNYAITGGTLSILNTVASTNSTGNYAAPVVSTSGNLVITQAAAPTASIAGNAGTTKTYGTNDPALTTVTLTPTGGFVNATVTDWNGANTTITDVASVASLARAGGEDVGNYAITGGTLSILNTVASTNSTGNYAAPVVSTSGNLVITQAAAPTASIAGNAGTTKTYGTNDPALTTVTLTPTGGFVNATVTDWNGANTTITDVASVASLARAGGEDVGNYAITGGTLSILNTVASTNSTGNYAAPVVSTSGNLVITQAAAPTASIAGNAGTTKTYGTNDPALTTVTLTPTGGFVNATVTDWNGANTTITDVASVASLARAGGEDVGNYAITGGTLSILNTVASTNSTGNYAAPVVSTSGNLVITQAAAPTASIAGNAGTTKTYGTNDPALTTVTLTPTGGFVNATVTDWNGANTTITDVASVASLARAGGEDVGNYAITGGTLSILNTVASTNSTGNYAAPVVSTSGNLVITQAAAPTASIAGNAGTTKTYGTNDPALTTVTLTPTGGFVNATVTDWNGANTTITDVASVASLARAGGEDVGNYAITGGTLSILNTVASTNSTGNYAAPVVSTSGNLVITQAAAPTASIAGNAGTTKTYGTNDPALTTVTLTPTGGFVNATVTDWNGANTTITDVASVASLARAGGEDVGNYAITGGTLSILNTVASTNSTGNYAAPVVSTSGNLVITQAAAPTASIAGNAGTTKTYGTNDPALTTVTLTPTGGFVNATVTDWNGANTTITDVASVASLARAGGEDVGNYAITGGTLSILNTVASTNSTGNYAAPVVSTSGNLVITQAAAPTASIAGNAGTTKTYGTNDPALTTVTLTPTGGFVNATVTDWNGANTTITDVASVASLARAGGEDVGNYAITGGTLSILNTVASTNSTGNYAAPVVSTSGNLVITQAAAPTASIAGNAGTTKTYGTNDPALTTVTLTPTGGFVNATVTDWNGANTTITDVASVASLARAGGEDVGNYAITGGTLSILNTVASTNSTGNYAAPVVSTSGNLVITQAAAPTASIAGNAGTTKTYGTNDPALTTVTLTPTGGFVNATVTDWNGANTTITDVASVASLARAGGEDVGNYAITGGTLSILNTVASTNSTGNYAAPVVSTSGNLVITQAAAPTASIAGNAGTTKTYGTNDPALTTVTLTPTGGFVNATVTDWNGANTTITDVASVASLARAGGEDVGNYAITGGTLSILNTVASTNSTGNYAAPVVSTSGNLVITQAAAPTASIAGNAGTTKTYGTNDPALTTVTLTPTGGFVNATVTDWNGANTTITDVASVASLARAGGEDVGNYAITGGTLSILNTVASTNSTGNYAAPVVSTSGNLVITQAAAPTASIAGNAGTTKTYGTNDPALTTVTLTPTGGFVNATVTDWNGANTTITDVASVASLARAGGEDVGNYAITGGTLSILNTVASTNSTGNYAAPVVSTSGNLVITQAAAPTASIAGNAGTTKTYGTNDPALTTVTLTPTGGFVNATVTDWNGANTTITDVASVASLARAGGEDVGNYAITGGTLSILNTVASTNSTGNYAAPVVSTSGNLVITQAAAPTASIAGNAGTTKTYGTNDPALTTVTLTPTGGFVNATVTDWNGANTTITDVASVASLARAGGEDVGNYAITGGTLSILNTVASTNSTGNYAAPVVSTSGNLVITQAAAPTASIAGNAGTTKTYGTNDPALTTVTLTPTGGFVNATVTDWNGANTTITDVASVASLARAGGEDVGNYAITGGTLSILNTVASTNSTGNYAAPVVSTSGNLVITQAAAPTASIAGNAGTTKTYGTNDPALTTVTLTPTGGFVNATVTDWNGANTTITDVASVASLARAGGEDVGNYAITGGTLSILNTVASTNSTGNYAAPVVSTSGNLVITQAAAPTASIAGNAGTTKTYGTNDPALTTVTLTPTGGFVNATVTDWNGANTTITDVASVASLARAGGEDVGNYAITGGTLSILNTVASTNSTGNYAAPVVSTSGNLVITQAAAPTASIAGNAGTTKTYGTNDPALTTVTLTPTGGFVNATVTDWNGANTTITDVASVASLARAGGEDVGNYAITGGTLSILNTVASTNSTGNYAAPVVSTSGNLVITQAAAPTASIAGNAGTTKTYGTNDPALTTVTLTPTGGFVNATVTDWNGANTTITDVASVASLARAGGEDVGNYAITGGTLSILNTVASTNSTGNYAAPVVSTSGNLVITQAAAPTASIAGNAGTTKTYGTNDPALTTVTLTPTGGFVNATVTDWNGANTTITDVASVASLARAGGEDVGNYAITGGTLSILNTVASTNSTGNYAAPVVSTSGNLVITQAAAPTASIAGNAGTTKTYGTNDPALTTVTLTPTGGFVNATVTDWNGANTTITDVASVASLARAGGEDVGNYAITGGTLSILNTVASTNSTGNYAAPVVSTSGNLVITQAAAPTASIAGNAGTTKTYGTNDPALTTVTLTPTGGFVNATVTDWNGANTTITDVASVASLARAGGEDVGNYAITGGTLSILNTVASTNSTGNYAAPVVSTSGNLVITQAAAPTASIAGNAGTTKTYGTNDPALTTVTLTPTGGFVNATVTDWNGANTTITDVASVASLARAGGEDVGNYAITGGTLSILNTVASTNSTGNYAAPVVSTSGNLVITQAAAPTASIAGNAGTTKTYGTNDPALTTVTLTPTGGFVNATVTDWNGANTTITDVASVASLARAGGEDVGNYAITGGTLSILNTVASTNSTGNYAAPVVSTSGNLVITQAALVVTANAQSKTYGAADPVLTFGAAGLVSATVTDWNSGSTTITDTIASALSGALSRAAGESVLGSPYAITQGTLAANVNYNITTFTGSNLTLAPAPLSVTADDATRLVSQANPPFSASYSGFQFAETPAALTGALSFSTTATVASPVGSYPITPFGQSSTNYAISYIDGNLAVTSGAPVSPQPLASNPDVTNLVVSGLYQLGDGVAQRSLADCSGVSVWAPWSCGNQNTEPVLLVAAPAVTGALPQPAPETAEFLALRPTPELMTTPAPPVTSPSPQLAPDVAAVPALRPTPELATAPGSGTLKFNDVMTAVMHRDRAAVVQLLDLGWWVDRPDSNGLTPLMAAALNGDATMTELLLQRGADPNRRAAGRSVLDYAARGGDSKVIELLRRAGAR